MNIDNILNKIFKLRAVPKKNLNNIKFVLKKLGNPEKNLKIIHIAGTNGKGSAASMLESVLITAGYNVGKFTSPHIIKFNERIVYNKKEIPDEEIAGFFDIIEKITEKYIDEIIHITETFGAHFVFQNVVAIPHGDASKNVNISSVSILKLRKAVLFPGEKKVSLIFFISAKRKKDHVKSIEDIIKLMKNTEFIEKTNTVKNTEEFLELIKLYLMP